MKATISGRTIDTNALPLVVGVNPALPARREPNESDTRDFAV